MKVQQFPFEYNIYIICDKLALYPRTEIYVEIGLYQTKKNNARNESEDCKSRILFRENNLFSHYEKIDIDLLVLHNILLQGEKNNSQKLVNNIIILILLLL